MGNFSKPGNTGNVDRKDQENNEHLPTSVANAPSERFQTVQQTQAASEAEETTSPHSEFKSKREKASGSALKQEVASRMLSDKAVGGVIPSSVTGLRSMSYSGDDGTVFGSAASSPMVGQSNRNDTRFGKKLDATAKKINYIPSEQVLVEYDESKPLAQSKDSVQGYNGTYKTEEVRQQKKSGSVPGELLYDRSLDLISRDHVYFSTGQVVKGAGSYIDTPTKTVTGWANNAPADADYNITRGNYLNRKLKVTFSHGKVTKFEFDTMNCNVENELDNVLNQASVNEVIDMNVAELDRQNIDAKAGDEKADIWSPLARAVQQPTQTVGYLRDLENITGSEVFMAYKKTAACMSYQLNRAAKDGQHAHRPMVEALTGLINRNLSSKDYDGIDPFDKNLMKKGASSLMIAAFDSTSKYKTKADILIQPRSFKMHLQTADNNMNVLRCKPEFVASVNANEVFSTIDRDYDPMAPVCMSDRCGIMHCYDFNDLYSYTQENGEKAFTKKPLKYAYADLRNNYIVEAALPLLSGISNYLNDNAVAFNRALSGDSMSEVVLEIPIVHATQHFSLWSLIVLASTPYILKDRVSSMKDVLYYETNVEYPFSQLKKLEEMNPMNANNYANPDYLEPLQTKVMLPSAKLTWVMPELFIPVDEVSSDNGCRTIAPWYFNQEQFERDGDVFHLKDRSGMMSYPSIRSGVRYSYLDSLYDMEERDIRLCLDRMIYPVVEEIEGEDYFVYKYSASADGIPTILLNDINCTIQTFCSTPRELGWFFVAPYGLFNVVEEHNSTVFSAYGQYMAPGAPMAFSTSYRVIHWHADGEVANSILDPASLNISRAANYSQQWDAIPATYARGENATTALNYDPGFVLSLGYLFTATSDTTVSPVDNKSMFSPFVSVNQYGAEVKSNAFSILSLQKAIWTRLQKLPFAISPWDAVAFAKHSGEDAPKVDPFDLLYYFGLAGFRASDYNEDIYNRETEKFNKGFLFTKDPFVAASPIFRDAIKYSEV